jgi:hypothetical protein
VLFLSKTGVSIVPQAFQAFFDLGQQFLGTRYTGPFRPCAAGGDSIGYGASNGETGTLAAVLADSAGDDFCLSCNHVIANLNAAVAGTNEVWQPGSADGGTSHSRIGLLHDFEPLVFGGVTINQMDAAVASLDAAVIRSNVIGGGIGIIGGSDPSPGFNIPVKKCGKVTGTTYGHLAFHTISMVMPYSAGDAFFVNQYGILGSGGTVFALEGDSGALVVNNGLEAVGLLFGIANTGDIVVANPIDPILTRFGLHFR